jgi:fatty-acyl-CoA synthase
VSTFEASTIRPTYHAPAGRGPHEKPVQVTDPRSLQHSVELVASRFPDRGVAIFDRRGRSRERRTYPELLAAARVHAGRWSALGVSPHDPVLISLPTSWAWFDAWLGALLLGALPVAHVPAPAFGAAEGHVRRLAAIVDALGASRAVVSEAVVSEAQRLGERALCDAAIVPSELAKVTPTDFVAPSPSSGEAAFLQLTSGSTGLPRGVIVPHRAALHNPMAIDHAVGAPRGGQARAFTDEIVSWLPLHHDMGLVGCFLLAVTYGYELTLFQPATFLARPHLWLEAMSRGRPCMTTAPNFAYQRCVERVGERHRRGLDLGFLRNAMTGAEMIRPETVEAFRATFGTAGFGASTFRPCYGLAEATLAATFDQSGGVVRTLPAPPDTDRGLGLTELVCNGTPVLDTEIRIAGPGDVALPDGTVGEVQIRGPGVFGGYYRDAEATEASLRNGWLCTEDLGFLDSGELYLTGRTKDVLIIRGHNFMPHELEWIAEGITGGGGEHRAGAFAVVGGAHGEEAVLVVEAPNGSPERLGSLAREIRTAVGRDLSLSLADIVFVRRGRLPRTSSGKIRRKELRDHYLEGALQRLHCHGDSPETRA